jgi:phenylacetate-CoA ligase
MRPAERIRNFLFWKYDLMKGGVVTRHYKEIKSLNECSDRNLTILHQNACLTRILKHAVETTRYYSRFKGIRSIEDFPIISKSTVRENFSDILSINYKVQGLHKVTTSGSTGAPLTVYQDKIKRARHQADNIYFSEIGGYPLGSRLYYLRVWNDHNRKNAVKRIMQNISMEDASNLSDKFFMDLIARINNDKSTKALLAFSSTCEAMSYFVESHKHSLPQNISAVFTMSETLPEGAKQALREALNCPVVSRYSNMENGFLAQQCMEENNEYHLNEASYYIELMHPDRDEYVSYGELGRVIVTDLFNYAMPMIRYDTGDMAILQGESLCGRPGKVFSRVEGRKVDFIYNTQGNLLSPHVITNTMWKYSSEIRQFQFIQNGPDQYLIKLNCPETVFRRENELIKELQHYLGDSARIATEYVNDIPMLASGKRKKIVNNFK